MEHSILYFLLNFYLIGIVASIIGCSIFITTEIISGRRMLFSSKEVWLGILFYTVVSWLGFMVYCWCLYLTYIKKEI